MLLYGRDRAVGTSNTRYVMVDLIQKALKAEKGVSVNKKIPDYNPIYKDSVEMARRMAIHFDGTFPEFLFKERAPNEDPKEFEYRKLIYKPITKPYMGRALGIVNRMWNDKNYSVEWKDEDGQRDYFLSEYPKYKDIYNYFEQVVTTLKLKDANAVLCVKPLVIPMTEEGEVDETAFPEPVAVIYGAEQVVHYEDGRCLIKLKEKSKFTVGGAEQEGRIFEYYDRENIWRIVQVSQDTDKEVRFEYYPFFTGGHNLEKMPAWKLKGIPRDEEGEILYESYFSPALPSLECALTDHSTLQMSKNAFAFPQKWEIVDDCNNKLCNNGLVTDWEGEGDNRKQVTVECPTCKGSGNSTGSPLGVYQIKARNIDGTDKNNLPTPPVGFLAPPSEILEFSRKEIKEAIWEGFSMLNIDLSNSNVKGSETALGKMIDREELFSFLRGISNELFDLFENTVNAIGIMRYGVFEAPVITRPSTFRIRDDEELTDELAKEGIPDFAKRKILREFNNARFINDAEAEMVADIVFRCDRLITKTDQQIQTMKYLNAVKQEYITLHYNIMFYLEDMEIYKEDGTPVDIQAIKEELLRRAKADTTETGNTPDLMARVNGA